MVCLMLRSVWPLLIESALILLQTVPAHIDIEELKKKLLQQCDGVLAVHEFHIWQLAGDRIIASAHIRCLNLSEYMKVSGILPSLSNHHLKKSKKNSASVRQIFSLMKCQICIHFT